MSLTVRAALIVHLKSYKILTAEPHRITRHGREYELRIATWNIERLKHKKSLEQILLACEQIQADILVLTETDHRVYPIIGTASIHRRWRIFSPHSTAPLRTGYPSTQITHASGNTRLATSIPRCVLNWKQKKAVYWSMEPSLAFTETGTPRFSSP